MRTATELDQHREAILVMLDEAYAFLGRELPPATSFTMLGDLESFELGEIERAIRMHRHDPDRGRFPPLTGDLYRYLREAPETLAERAWGLLIDSISRIGCYSGIRVDDDAAAMVALRSVGGWKTFGSMTERDLPFRKREFVTAYVAAARVPPPESMIPKFLPGINTDGRVTLIRLSDGSRTDSHERLLTANQSTMPNNILALARDSGIAS